MSSDLEQLQDRLQYHFKDIHYLTLALTHSSYVNEHRKQNNGEYNERIEFLGDAVLELISSDFLYRNYPQYSEGEMTKTRASLVCEYSLAACAREIELGSYLFLSKGEDATGGRQRDSILADALESVLGAIYLDGGIEPASALIHRILLKDIESKQLFYDAKTILQELVQSKKNQVLVYRVVREDGPDHNKEFTIEAVLNDEVVGCGVGRSKKLAEQQAAYEALVNLQE